MLSKVFKIFLLSAGVSFFALNQASAQLLTGFDEPVDRPRKIERAPRENSFLTQDVKPSRNNNQSVEKPSGHLLTGFTDFTTQSKIQGSTPGRSEEFPPYVPVQKDNNYTPDKNKSPVDLQADRLENDDANKIVTASGNVMLVQDGRILRADEIKYYVRQDRVVAKGYVVLNEVNGDIHTADSIELTDEMKSGFVSELQTYLVDGSRFKAKEGERINAQKTIMRDASYTACEPCKEDPSKPVVWQINADTVTYHEDENRIAYENAWFEFYGIPVAYTPYFSHPDGTIERKSGFLSPTFGLDSELGFSAGSAYYWAIAPDKDATVGLRAYSEQLPLLTAEWRQGWENASMKLNGGITYSERKDSEAGQRVTKDEEVRGHIFGEGLWDINNKWRTGFDLEYSSDDQYLRQYDFSGEDVLQSQLYAERFSGRNYSSARLITFQDVRIGELQNDDQPQVLPEIVSSWMGEPGSMPLIGGRWEVEGTALGLRREGDDQDVGRLSLKTAWYRRFVSDMGLLATIDASLRGDFYSIKDSELASQTGNTENESSESRFFPQIHAQASYPLAKNFEKFQMTIEPLVALTAAPEIDENESIPNEDSQDIQIDPSNLFEANRFPGFDKVEDKSRVTYGIRTGAYGYGGSSGSIFFGQSYRFDKDGNPFPAGSGLDDQESDYVGEIMADYKDKYFLDYRLQLDNETLQSEKHEIEGSGQFGKLFLSARYLYANALDGTEIDESREQFRSDASYDWNDEWRTKIGAVQDLGTTPGLRRAYAGLDHFGQCLNWSVTAVRNLTDDASGDSSTELLLRIGLKNLGEFQASGIELASSSSSSDEDDEEYVESFED